MKSSPRNIKVTKRSTSGGEFMQYHHCCIFDADDWSRLFCGPASLDPEPPEAELVTRFSERVSQLTHAAASSTPSGLGGLGGSDILRSLWPTEGHVSIRYTSISWRQLLTLSCPQRQTLQQKKKITASFFSPQLFMQIANQPQQFRKIHH